MLHCTVYKVRCKISVQTPKQTFIAHVKGDILHGYWNSSEVQSLVYIIDNSLATKCYMAKMETFGCRMREACEPNTI